MGIFSRMNTVIKSNLNALVDKAEDPEKLISQTIIDMKAELKRAKRDLVTTLGNAKRLDKEAAEAGEEVKSWEKKAVLAIKSGDDKLAREALKQKQRVTKKHEEVRGRAAQQLSMAEEMKDALERIEAKIEDLEARKTALASQVRKAREAPDGVGGSRFGSESLDELERMAGRIDQLDAEVESHSVLDDGPSKADLDARFRALEKTSGDVAVDDELAALKASLDD
ncbi:MAG: PspA/IM30 family protein [Sandaracinus sp.]|nr:PspA/IM30 family protein [Sandaracinus sp.]MCB9619098.1 PspA/IM30 family protein [Sandaracinus sp.]MCB9622711.1 PspA/IM30 family protein [Sandaracinus sp.]